MDIALGGLGPGSSKPHADRGEGPDPGLFDLPLKEARESFEKAYLLRHLQGHEGSVAALARVSGMERTNLYRKLKALGIDPKGS